MKKKFGSGDDGTTGIRGGERITKDADLAEALGSIDEASAAVGLARSLVHDDEVGRLLLGCQETLRKCAAETARPPGAEGRAFDFASAADALVSRINALSGRLPEREGFEIPGEQTGEAALHLARAVVRRAERRSFALRARGAVPADLPVYLNRLSDLLFELARLAKQPRDSR